MPIFMYHGGEDQIIPPEASRQYFSHMKLPDKQLKIYAGGFHEPHNDLQKLEVFEDIENWMDKQE
jgi:alpha-beta hydrolase superfamily lysophospholipase